MFYSLQQFRLGNRLSRLHRRNSFGYSRFFPVQTEVLSRVHFRLGSGRLRLAEMVSAVVSALPVSPPKNDQVQLHMLLSGSGSGFGRAGFPAGFSGLNLGLISAG